MFEDFQVFSCLGPVIFDGFQAFFFCLGAVVFEVFQVVLLVGKGGGGVHVMRAGRLKRDRLGRLDFHVQKASRMSSMLFVMAYHSSSELSYLILALALSYLAGFRCSSIS